MSNEQNLNISNSRSKFTRGEKCIFTHVVLTFCLVLIAVFTYLVHLYLVHHNTETLFNTRRYAPTYASLRLDAVPIGIIYLNITPVLPTCNTLLLRRQWSLGPGHCITLMSQPDLSHILFEWRIKYRDNEGVIIKRSVVHPHFDTNTFENNIGVIYHSDVIGLQEYNLPNTNYQKLNNDFDSESKLLIISWLEPLSPIKDHKHHIGIFPAQLLPKENCPVQMAPIVDLRNYETCAVFEKVVYTSLGVIIKRSVVHPHFDTNTFENNIGVIYHSDVIGLQEYNLPNTNYQKLNNDFDSESKLLIISWLEPLSPIKDHKHHIGIFPAQLLPKENCPVQMAPIVDLRNYETCAVFEKVVYTSLEHGALALQMDNLQVLGFFAWGEKIHRNFPLVILNLSYFQEWVEIAMTL